MRYHLLRVVALGIGAIAACTDAPPAIDRPIESPTLDGSCLLRAPAGALTSPSAAARADIVRGYLRDHGGLAATQLYLASERPARGDITHVRLEQQIAGLRVHGSYVKAALGPNGELVQVIERTAPVGAVTEARITE